MDIEDEESRLVGINDDYIHPNSPTKRKNISILSYLNLLNNQYILPIILIILFFIYFMYSRNIYINQLNNGQNNNQQSTINNNEIIPIVSNDSNSIDANELVKDIKLLQSKICKCDKCPICPLSVGFTDKPKVDTCPICTTTNTPVQSTSTIQPICPAASKYYLLGDRTDIKNSVHYIHSDIPDSELPNVKLYFDGDPWIPWETKNKYNDCSNYCTYVDGAQMKTADALVFNVPSHSGGFYSGVREDAIIISFCLEAKGPNGMCGRLHDQSYYKKYHLHSNYDLNSDIPAMYTIPELDVLLKPAPAKTRKDKLATFMSSRCVQPRTSRFGELMSMIQIDSYGKCNNNAHLPANDANTVLRVFGEYKFHIAYENSDEPGYITEKFWKGFEAGSVPVYFGHEDAWLRKYAPGENSFINANDFKSLRDLADYLLLLDKNDVLYNRYFEWKKYPLRPEFLTYKTLDWNTIACRLCRRVALTKKERSKK